MTNTFINEAQLLEKWSDVIGNMNITDPRKKTWMSLIAQNQKLNEDVYNNAHVNPNMNVPGMGSVSFPGDPSYTYNFANQTPGSGDTPYSLLPLALQVAAQTVGLDLLPVVPMSGPMGMLTYLDSVYAGGKLNSKEAPFVLKVPLSVTSGVTLTQGTIYYAIEGGDSYYQFTYIGDSRLDGYAIFKVVATDTDGTARAIGAAGIKTPAEVISGGDLQDAATAGAIVATFDGPAELVKALEDHIEGFSSRSLRLGDGVTNAEEPYLREEGESEPENMMGLTLKTKSVSAQTLQVAAAVTREQIDDLRQYNIDAVGQLESILSNELTQTLNKLILSKMFRLGTTSHSKWFSSRGENFNINYSTLDANILVGEDNTGTPVQMATKKINTTLGGESISTLQRTILTMILGASNAINNHARRGNGNFVVTNYQVGTVLQSIAGFTAYPLSNTISQTGSMYNIGSIAGMQVYVDPNMDWQDTRVLVGRKGENNQTGLIFAPYLLAQNTSIIAESTMAPKMSLKSRFALVEAGHHPEDTYITFKINNAGDIFGNSILG